MPKGRMDVAKSADIDPSTNQSWSAAKGQRPKNIVMSAQFARSDEQMTLMVTEHQDTQSHMKDSELEKDSETNAFLAEHYKEQEQRRQSSQKKRPLQ